MPKKKIKVYKEMNVPMIGRRLSSGVTSSVLVASVIGELLADGEVQRKASEFWLTFTGMATSDRRTSVNTQMILSIIDHGEWENESKQRGIIDLTSSWNS